MSSLPQSLHDKARQAFTGFPTRRMEAYKYSDLSMLAQRELGAMAGLEASDPMVKQSRADIVIGNAALCHAQSPHAGLTVQRLDAHPLLGEFLPLEERPVAALNSIHAQSVLYIHVAKGVQLQEPLTLDVVTQGEGAAYPRVLIVLEEEASLRLEERFYGTGSYVNCGMMEVSLAKGAKLFHTRDQNEDKRATHLFTAAIKIAQRACYSSYAFNEGAALMRHEIAASLDGAQAHTDLCGINMIAGNQHLDTATFIDHAQADATSNELYKSAIAGNATAVFQGKIHVAKDAQRTQGYQMSRGLLLSDKARINTKPELEIYADDVVCSHGATVGALDEESLFYLRARGIPCARARRLLVEGFIAEVLDNLDAPCREILMQRAGLWLESF